MYKKEGKRGQVTVFIIVGLLILVAFFLVYLLANTLTLSNLQSQADDLISSSFKKEALRLFVDDCLQDNLESGLSLLSKQGGRFWDDQPGGVRPFTTTITDINGNTQTINNGVQVDSNQGGRVLYALKNEQYTQFQAFPCNTEANAPFFCKYQSPDITIGYGTIALRPSSIEADLAAYLKQKVRECVVEFTQTEISQFAEIQDTDITLDVNLFSDGVAVNVEYPLQFQVQGEEYFHLSDFDFFYPTIYKQVLDVAALIPLEKDRRYLDFTYDQATLQADSFQYQSTTDLTSGSTQCTLNSATNLYTCTAPIGTQRFADLSLQLQQSTQQERQALNGDTIYKITSPAGSVIQTDPNFELRIARQNRPPALDYIQRLSCHDPNIPAAQHYDYLVIKDSTDLADPTNSNSQLGQIFLVPNALDPDEDTPQYAIDASSFGLQQPITTALQLTTSEVSQLTQGLHTIRVQTQDEFGAQDFQDVRVLIDRPVTTNIQLTSPYDDITYQQSDGSYVVSKEDPVFVTITTPTQSSAGFSQSTTLQLANEAPQNIPTTTGSNQACFSLPSGNVAIQQQDTCTLASFPDTTNTAQVVANIKKTDVFTRNPFQGISGRTQISLDFTTNYCGNLPQQTNTQIDVFVTECVPHRNPNYLSAPYHNIDPQTGQPRTDPINSPFLADHTCCLANPTNPQDPTGWQLAPVGTPCYTNPNPGCYGLGTTTDKPDGNFVMENQVATCDGTRGNYCGSLTSDFVEGPITCGVNGQVQCSGIADACQDSSSWMAKIVNGQTGICMGTLGCSNFCTTELVAPQNTALTLPSYTTTALNLHAKRNDFSTDTQLGISCGCTRQDAIDGKACDANFDGIFEGICQGPGECI